jgi:RNA polymerase sigma-70 factor (ECF subfamily)
MTSVESLQTNQAAPLVEHFFRHEYGRLVSVLTSSYGFRHFDLVEDTVQAALVEALRHWRIAGAPANPFAWVRRVAQNRIIDALRRNQPESISQDAESGVGTPEIWFSDSGIADSELRMVFACCNPSLAIEAQLALTLKSLCGFSNAEIARGLLTSEENVKKRLTRAKSELIDRGSTLEIPSAKQLADRLDSVHRVMYLMFNEGYSSASDDQPVRADLCDEAMRLCRLLTDAACSTPATEALAALMMFHTARLPGRMDPNGSLVLLQDQDRQKWDWRLITEASRILSEAARGDHISRYHLEAGIAMLHSHAPSFAATNWAAILRHYDLLIQLEPSPVYELNRAVALAELHGPDAGIAALANIEEIRHYHLLDATYGEFHRRAGQLKEAMKYFNSAREKTKSPFEKELLDRKLALCTS